MLKTAFYASLALIAFAANSVLCRMALGDGQIDAAGFTAIRLLSGALVLWLILQFSGRQAHSRGKGSWRASLLLFAYAVMFSFAYLSLDTATGALILFGAVQLTMLTLAIFAGERLQPLEWLGLAAAFAGFVYLMLPSATTPSLSGFLMMAAAGIAWGVYTLIGRGSTQPLAETAGNFLRTLLPTAILALLFLQPSQLTTTGTLLAVLSGAVASGIGYSIWYAALPGLSSSVAAASQLLVPVIAALGGVLLVDEALTLRFGVAAALILGGIALVIAAKRRALAVSKP